MESVRDPGFLETWLITINNSKPTEDASQKWHDTLPETNSKFTPE